jgi:hypothetical protein
MLVEALLSALPMSPVQAFGTDITGLGTAFGVLHTLFTDGTSQDISVAGRTSGAPDLGKSVLSVQMKLQGVTANSTDIFSVDDVSFDAKPELFTLYSFAG